jgi:hypothetical protein
MALPVINDGFTVNNASADSPVFNLVGGYYAMSVLASDFSSTVALMALGPDAATFVPVVDPAGNMIGNFTANSMVSSFQLPPGTYMVAVDSSTGVYVQLARINI